MAWVRKVRRGAVDRPVESNALNRVQRAAHRLRAARFLYPECHQMTDDEFAHFFRQEVAAGRAGGLGIEAWRDGGRP